METNPNKFSGAAHRSKSPKAGASTEPPPGATDDATSTTTINYCHYSFKWYAASMLSLQPGADPAYFMKGNIDAKLGWCHRIGMLLALGCSMVFKILRVFKESPHPDEKQRQQISY